jgi:hypothetical protein
MDEVMALHRLLRTVSVFHSSELLANSVLCRENSSDYFNLIEYYHLFKTHITQTFSLFVDQIITYYI